MWKVVIGGIVGYLRGVLVTSGVFLSLTPMTASLDTPAVLFMAFWSGGQWATLGSLAGATSAIIDAMRKRSPDRDNVS